jgi:transposase
LKATPIPRLEVSMNELQDALEHARSALSEKEYSQLKAALETLGYLTELIEDKETTLRRLRQILFGPSTEKTRKVLGELSGPKEGKPGTEASDTEGSAAAEGQATPASATRAEEAKGDSGSEEKPERPRVPGHGRNGAEAYTGAHKVVVPNTEVKVGQRCPLCLKGKLYELRTPGVIVRVTGQAPLTATIYELQKLRCNLCGEVFTAEPPAGVGTKKYDEAAAAMLAVLRYGRGVPFYRLEGLQNNLGVPLPASTQFEILEETSEILAPIYEELIRQAAQGEVVYNDDTGVKILELMKENQEKEKQKGKAPPGRGAGGGGDGNAKKSDPERTGMHTSGVVSTRQGQKIALFFSGRKHAGENLGEVLKRRAQELGPPIQMCDALDYNVPKDFAVILGNCCAHARRKVVEEADNFPVECKKVLDIFADVYKAEAETQKLGLSPAERLAYHQAHSEPRMKELEEWIAVQFAERHVEPNSGLGKALKYLENHWGKLTLFLRVGAAPIDNNIVERALKKAILQRKNSLFYKTENGAAVGDMYTSFIHTCELNEVNAYDYLIELQKHADASRNPAEWMPWNYRETIRRLESSMGSCTAVA